jgi:hypothetical protein
MLFVVVVVEDSRAVKQAYLAAWAWCACAPDHRAVPRKLAVNFYRTFHDVQSYCDMTQRTSHRPCVARRSCDNPQLRVTLVDWPSTSSCDIVRLLEEQASVRAVPTEAGWAPIGMQSLSYVSPGGCQSRACPGFWQESRFSPLRAEHATWALCGQTPSRVRGEVPRLRLLSFWGTTVQRRS